MDTAKNGKAEENNRRDCNSVYPHGSEGLARPETASEINGFCNQDGFYNCYSPRADFSENFDEGDSAVGKILTRLKELESGYESLLFEQEEKLHTQLKEVREKVAKLKESGKEIEKDIQQLMSGEE
jgi:hypothetical protein